MSVGVMTTTPASAMTASMVPGVGAYLRACRKALGLTQEEVAAQLDVAGRTISDWERGRYEPGSAILARFVSVVKGSADDVQRLFEQNADVEEGARVAREWLGQDRVERIAANVRGLSDEELERAVRIFDRIKAERAARARRGFGGHTRFRSRRRRDPQ